jgi:hypothetical protein
MENKKTKMNKRENEDDGWRERQKKVLSFCLHTRVYLRFATTLYNTGTSIELRGYVNIRTIITYVTHHSSTQRSLFVSEFEYRFF